MEDKPGIERAIPGALLGIIVGVLFVVLIRRVSGIEPAWDFGLILVVTPFTLIGGWLWGIGAFNPRWSVHAHPPDEEHGETAIVPAEEHGEYEASRGGVFMNAVWKITTYTLLLFLILLGLAVVPINIFPFGYFVRQANDPEASFGAFANNVGVNLPLVGEFQTSQIWLFVALVAAVIIPLLLVGGGLALAFYLGHREAATTAEQEPTPEQVTPPGAVRWAGRVALSIAGGLRRGLPKFLGNR